jgi:NADPH:quinone reductase-like Zn-dependent oxidoreductase
LDTADPNNAQIEGGDVAGEVVKAGKNVKIFGVGDRVAGFTKYGAYAEYTVGGARRETLESSADMLTRSPVSGCSSKHRFPYRRRQELPR